MTPWHYHTVHLWLHDTMTQWRHDTITACTYDSMTPWHYGALWYDDTMTAVPHDTMTPQGLDAGNEGSSATDLMLPGSMFAWHPGTLAPWHPGTLAVCSPGATLGSKVPLTQNDLLWSDVTNPRYGGRPRPSGGGRVNQQNTGQIEKN